MKIELSSFRPLLFMLLLAVPAFIAVYLLSSAGVHLSTRINVLLFFLNFISLFAVVTAYILKHDTSGYVFMGMMLLKFGGVLYVAYNFPEFKNNIPAYLLLYAYYLVTETVLVVRMVGKTRQKS